MKAFKIVFYVLASAIMLGITSSLFADAANAVPSKVHRARFYYIHGVRMGTFALASDVQIELGTNHAAALNELAAGQTAHISYTIESGLFVAHQIKVNVPQSKPATGTAPAVNSGSTPEASNPKPQQKHVHGVIVSYNTSTGSITIRNPR